PCKCRDPARGIQPADDVVACISNVQVADGIETQPRRLKQLGMDAGTIVTGVAANPVPGHRADHTGGIYETHDVRRVIANVEGAITRRQYRVWNIELCG